MSLELYRHFETRGLRYAVVGDVSEYPERIRSDLDIVIEPEFIRDVSRLLEDFFEERGARLAQALQHEQTAWHFSFVWEDDMEVLQFIHPDLCGDYYRNGRLLLAAKEILSNRVRATGPGGDDLGFYVPRPATAFLYYLLKRIDKADLGETQGRYLSEQWRRDPQGAEMQTRRFWSAGEATRIRRAAESEDWGSLQASIPSLRRSLRSRVGWRPSWWMGELRRIIGRLRHPTGIWLAVLGPDGSGKSTVIERLRTELAPLFRRTRVVHLRPFLGRSRSQSGPVTEPHAERPRSSTASLIKLGYWLFDYSMGYLLQTRPALIRSTLVLYDRYYPDLLADPMRYRYGASLRPVRGMMGLIPQPNLYVVLDVDSSVIHERKTELPIDELERQRGVYRALARSLSNAHLVDASVPPDQVARRVEGLVLDHMERRVLHRLAPRRKTLRRSL